MIKSVVRGYKIKATTKVDCVSVCSLHLHMLGMVAYTIDHIFGFQHARANFVDGREQRESEEKND
jgi:hypothetical protein